MTSGGLAFLKERVGTTVSSHTSHGLGDLIMESVHCRKLFLEGPTVKSLNFLEIKP